MILESRIQEFVIHIPIISIFRARDERVKIKNISIAICCLSVFLLVNSRDSTGINTAASPSQVPSQSSEILFKLNQWDSEELNEFECPDRYPDRVPSSQTGGWIISHKRMLEGMGVYVRWNCEGKEFEIVSDGLSSIPICGCQ